MATITQGETQPVNSMTELDWAVRADGTMVAVVTPMYVASGGAGLSTQSFQYGCLAFDFYLTDTSAPFGGLVATLNDTDGSATSGPSFPLWEELGSNGCTYEPMSNTGIVIVRRLVNSSYAYPFSPSQDQTFSIMDTGVLP